jgi:hypothetical protein
MGFSQRQQVQKKLQTKISSSSIRCRLFNAVWKMGLSAQTVWVRPVGAIAAVIDKVFIMTRRTSGFGKTLLRHQAMSTAK